MQGHQRIYANTSLKTLETINSAPECKDINIQGEISRDIRDYDVYRKKIEKIKGSKAKQKLANEYASSRDISNNPSIFTKGQQAWMKYYSTNNLDAIWYAGAELGHGIGKSKRKKENDK